jgi:ligand-binding sensor domain-containing protein
MERGKPQLRFGLAAIAVTRLGLLLWSSPVLALDPSLDVIQYAHTVWRIREDTIRGEVQQIAQTREGYLWLATDSGLLRFDGFRMVPWEPPAGEHLPSNNVRGLLAARDGTLWIGTDRGLASWRDGKLAHYPELDGFDVATVLEDHERTVWAGGALWESVGPGKLCEIKDRRTQCYGSDGTFRYGVTALFEDRRRNLWLGTGNGLAMEPWSSESLCGCRRGAATYLSLLPERFCGKRARLSSDCKQ